MNIQASYLVCCHYLVDYFEELHWVYQVYLPLELAMVLHIHLEQVWVEVVLHSHHQQGILLEEHRSHQEGIVVVVGEAGHHIHQEQELGGVELHTH